MAGRTERPISGHVFRVEGKRRPVWRAKYRLPDGRQIQSTLGPAWTERGRPPHGHYTKRTAEAWLRSTLDQARAGTLPGLHRTGTTFEQACDEYLQHLEHDRQRKPSTLRDYRSTITRHLLPTFGPLPVEDITADRVERWQRWLSAQPISNRTKSKTITILHGIMERARRRHRLPANPVSFVEKPRTAARADIDVFSREEIRALVRAAESEQDAAIYLAAAFTGLRQGELLALRWRDIDFPGRRIRVASSYVGGVVSAPKSGRIRSVPLSRDVAQVLARLGQRGAFTGDDDLVFVGVAGEHLDASALRRRYKQALEAAGLRPLRFHDLRHTFGTLAVSGGAQILQVKAWMGHADISTTMVYLHYAPNPGEADLLDRALGADGGDEGAEEPTGLRE